MHSTTLSNLKIAIVKDFFAHGIIKVNTQTLFKLSSGLELPIYLDHRLIFSIPRLRTNVVEAWSLMLSNHLRQNDHIELNSNENIVFAGTATAGIAPAYALSAHFNAGFIYVRDKSKAHGLKSQIEGVATEQNQFIIVDDMVVTGGSLLKACNVLQNMFGKDHVLCATSISCHESSIMRETFAQHHTHLLPLFTTKEIFTIAHQQHVIDAKTFDILMECLKTFDKKS